MVQMAVYMNSEVKFDFFTPMQWIKVWMAFYHKMSFDKIYIFLGVFSSSSSVDYLHLISKWFSVYNYQILTFRVSERVCACVSVSVYCL